jgi:hypothetical protein
VVLPLFIRESRIIVVHNPDLRLCMCLCRVQLSSCHPQGYLRHFFWRRDRVDLCWEVWCHTTRFPLTSLRWLVPTRRGPVNNISALFEKCCVQTYGCPLFLDESRATWVSRISFQSTSSLVYHNRIIRLYRTTYFV